MPTPQARYWLLTIPADDWSPPGDIVSPLCYLKGQKEVGASGYIHWQLLAVCNKKVTRNQVKALFCPTAHVEASRSSAANDYVWKDDTAVPGTRLEVGALPVHRNEKKDWDQILSNAKRGAFDDIPADVLIRSYTSLKRICVDNMPNVPRPTVRAFWFWGKTGTGKTFKAWEEAGTSAYVKNPMTKWWDGYKGQENVIIDEFSGKIDITYLLRWLDPYPCTVEVKGFSTPLAAVNFWITSNLPPQIAYVGAELPHMDALLRRIDVVEFKTLTLPPAPRPLRTVSHLDLVCPDPNLTPSRN